MINWRNGKGGFVGGLKHLIKGVFQYAHTITTASVIIPPGPGQGVNGEINNNGIGDTGLINNDGVGQNGPIVLGFGINSVMNNNGIGMIGLINNDGIGANGDI